MSAKVDKYMRKNFQKIRSTGGTYRGRMKPQGSKCPKVDGMDAEGQKNYNSGSDFVLEFGDLRFSFNDNDFSQRIEQAAHKIGFVDGQLNDHELTDLLCLTVNGEIDDPASSLGEHIIDNWFELVGPAERSLVHWLRRLVFRGAWLDQRVKDEELDIQFEENAQEFKYVRPEDGTEVIVLEPGFSLSRYAYKR